MRQTSKNLDRLSKILAVILKNFKSNPYLKTLVKLFVLLVPLYFILDFFQIFPDYLYILEFIITRVVFISVLLIVLQFLTNLPVSKSFQAEYEIFNEEFKHYPFVTFLRKYNFYLFLVSYICFSLATTYYVDNYMVSNVLGIITIFSVTLYITQFVVYMGRHIQRPVKPTAPYTGKNLIKRYVGTWIPQAQKVGVACLECVKVAVQLGFGAEAAWKLSHGGMNDVSPWRQEGLNRMFPEDRTGIWTESKAGAAIHNRSMGYPHDTLYSTKDTLGSLAEKAKKSPISDIQKKKTE